MIRVFVGGSNSRGSYTVYKGLPIKGWRTIPFIAIDHSKNVIWESYRLWGQHLTYLQMIPQFHVSCYLLLVTGDFLLTMLNQQNPTIWENMFVTFSKHRFQANLNYEKYGFREPSALPLNGTTTWMIFVGSTGRQNLRNGTTTVVGEAQRGGTSSGDTSWLGPRIQI